MSLAFAFAGLWADGPNRDRVFRESGDARGMEVCTPFTPSADDVALAERIRAGDGAALDALVARSYAPLLTYLTHAVGSSDVASDLLQELFVQLWRRRMIFPVDRPLLPYLIASARHRMLDYVRRERRSAKKLDDYAQWHEDDVTDDPLRDTERAELVQAAREAVERLPERSREVWRLSREQGLTFTEIAQALGISVNTVKTHMARAMAAVRGALIPFLSVITAAVWR